MNNPSNILYIFYWANLGSLANISLLSFPHSLQNKYFSPDLNSSADQKVHQHRLDLGLPGFEVVSADEDPFLHSQLDEPGYKGVLRGSIEVGASLQYTGHCKQSGGRNLFPGLTDGELTNRREAMRAKYVIYAED